MTIGTLAEAMGTTLQNKRFFRKCLASFFTMDGIFKSWLENNIRCQWVSPPRNNIKFQFQLTFPSGLDSNSRQMSTSESANPNPLQEEPNSVKLASGYRDRIKLSMSRCMVLLQDVQTCIQHPHSYWKRNIRLLFQIPDHLIWILLRETAENVPAHIVQVAQIDNIRRRNEADFGDIQFRAIHLRVSRFYADIANNWQWVPIMDKSFLTSPFWPFHQEWNASGGSTYSGRNLSGWKIQYKSCFCSRFIRFTTSSRDMFIGLLASVPVSLAHSLAGIMWWKSGPLFVCGVQK